MTRIAGPGRDAPGGLGRVIDTLRLARPEADDVTLAALALALQGACPAGQAPQAAVRDLLAVRRSVARALAGEALERRLVAAFASCRGSLASA